MIINACSYDSPCGTLLLGEYDGRLCLCDWTESPHHCAIIARVSRRLGTSVVIVNHASRTECLVNAALQLDEYFSGHRHEFSIPLLPAGTEFQQRTWAEIQCLPYGVTCSYRELAVKAGCKSAVRAVAGATGANALSIFIPCHRVVGSNGSLTGYAGGIEAKRLLLKIEGL